MFENELKNEIDNLKFELELFKFIKNLNDTKKMTPDGMEALLKSIENISKFYFYIITFLEIEAAKRLQVTKIYTNTNNLFLMSSLKNLNRYFLKTQKFIQSFISC